MVALFVIVMVAGLAAMWMRWEKASPWTLGMTGVLSLALSVRVVALATAFYLLPAFAQMGWGDEQVKSDEQAKSEQTIKSDEPAEAAQDEPVVEAKEPAKAEVAIKPEAPSAISEPSQSPLPTPSSQVEESPIPAEAPEAAPATEAMNLANTSRGPVKTITKVHYLAENRPAWVESGPSYEQDMLKIPVKAGPYRTRRDCESDLNREISVAVADFINQHLHAEHASTFISFSPDELLRRNVVREQFQEELETSVGVMSQVHAQLAFDNAFRDELDLRWSEIRARSKLAQTGLGAGIITLLLGTLFGYFKVDTATKGYYTGRLQFLTAGTILTLVAASVVLAKWIPSM